MEAALYRAMEIPGVKALYPRPPKEAQEELSGWIGKTAEKSSTQAELYSLRALEDEKALDFSAAEKDWKAYVAHAADVTEARLALADYYHRRLMSEAEVTTLIEVGSSPSRPTEQYTSVREQRSWQAFERALKAIAAQGLDEGITKHAYAAWTARYPQQPSLYIREFSWLLDGKKFDDAAAVVAQYRQTFPQDEVFPTKASALLEYRRGSVDRALATYDAGFVPLWPAELVESYFALLKETHSLRRFSADAREQLARNPDDLGAMARLFYAAQQQGQMQAARGVVDSYRSSKEHRKAGWTAQELYTSVRLMDAIHAYPEEARYDFALYHAKGSLASGASPQEVGLSGMVRLLLSEPEQPVELGANNLSLYRDAATLDRGPGYWNGILSLWLNSESPSESYHEEELQAQSYFHRAKAAELLAMLDRKFPAAPERAALHKDLVDALAAYGESAPVVKAANDFLDTFTGAANEPNRVTVAMRMADAYGQMQDSRDEFALYDRMLTELGGLTAGMPLTAAAASKHAIYEAPPAEAGREANAAHDGETVDTTTNEPAKEVEASRAFEVNPEQPVDVFVAGSQEYRQLLERYLGRLAAIGRLPEALAVLRRELDRNPNDPLLYERLADFLQQNNLSAQQEEVYAQAIQKFQDHGWYDRLARLYLREKKREAYAELTRKVTGIFSGTELESWFTKASGGGPQFYLQLNLYAHQRFPHNEIFVRHLLQAYRSKGAYDASAWEKLMREHWSDTEEFRQEFFAYLSQTGKLDTELSQLHLLVPGLPEQKANPDAARELAEIEIRQSHFEASAPILGALAEAYPADEEIGTETSSVFRSLAYYDATQTERAIAVEKRMLQASPGNMDRLARIGDIYADSGADSSASSSAGHENITAAATYWRRIPEAHPGTPDGYLQAATVFWDYFQFDDALKEITEARAKFHKPALYGYEAGAIYEGKRDLTSAIREYTEAAIEDAGNDPAKSRLLRLARRKTTAQAVDDETAKAFVAHDSVAALTLREQVLTAEQRTAEIGPLLEAALSKATTAEMARTTGMEAQRQRLPLVYERALEREIALTADPVERIELSYELVRSFEGRQETGAASKLIEKVHDENPKLLGVVRTTADFYWRNRQPAKSIATLIAASDAAKKTQPELSRQFTVEAADKANNSGSYVQARELMAPLIDVAAGDGAYNAQYLSVVAESYARAGDEQGLKQFYLDKLTAIRTAVLGADERKQRTVLLRRGLIPALTAIKDYAGAVDQYIDILSAYPEDSSTAQEAALYALRYGRQNQLLDFLTTTLRDSPRDSRFPILLGQIQTTFENYPAAIDAYARATGIRADRMDVYEAKAGLEEGLQRLDDACRDYERLYVLSYRDPQWMVKVASARARQGRRNEVVAALRKAWLESGIEGRAPTPSDDFRVAKQLEAWGLLDEGLSFAEAGVKAEGDALLGGADPGERSGEDAEGAATYLRLATRLRQQEKALTVLEASLQSVNDSPDTPSAVIEQVAKQGLASVTDAEWRQHRMERRSKEAQQRYQRALMEMGKAAGAYFTPEEKGRFGTLVEAQYQEAQAATGIGPMTWIDVAHAAGLVDVEAHLRKQLLLLQGARKPRQLDPDLRAYAQLQESRLLYQELAETLGAYAEGMRPGLRAQLLAQQAEAYRHAGDEDAELQTLRKLDFGLESDARARERYLQLLLKRDAGGFEAFGVGNAREDLAVAAPNYAVAHSDFAVARASLHAHAATFGETWETAYSALLGLYFRDLSAGTETSFHRLLGDERTIGERVAINTNAGTRRDSELAGDVWFDYGMRYGVYRTLSQESERERRDPEDFLPAGLERNASPASYVELAKTYAETGQDAQAIAEYRHGLELIPDSAGMRDAIALLLWKEGKHEEAVTEWREAVATLARVQKTGAAPESFWSEFQAIAAHLGSRKLTGQLRPEIDALLRGYMKVNGEYRSESLLRAVFEASATPDEGLAWILSLCDAAPQSRWVLNAIDNAAWLKDGMRATILEREIDLERATAPQGSANDFDPYRVRRLERSLALYYAGRKMDAKAEILFDRLREDTPKRSLNPDESDETPADPELWTAEVEVAARRHRLDAVLARFPEDSAHGSRYGRDALYQALRNAAAGLAADEANPESKAEALAVWEFVFEQAELRHDLMASDYLGVANARLAVGDLAGAVGLLRRMVLLPQDAQPEFSQSSDRASDRAGGAGSDSAANPETGLESGGMRNYEHAAALLIEKKHDAEALEFLGALAKGVPWNGVYRLRLAQAQLRVGTSKAESLASLEALAGDRDQSYDVREQAALSLRGASTNAAKFGSEELRLLAKGTVSAPEARQPYFAAARMLAAETGGNQRGALLREAIAICPDGPSSAAGYRGDDLRRKIFRVEAASGHFATALTVLESLLTQTSVAPGSEDVTQESGETAARLDSEGDLGLANAGTSLASSDAGKLLARLLQAAPLPLEGGETETEKLALAVLVARVYEQNGLFANALPYWKLALYWEKDAARRTELRNEIARTETDLRLEAANALRRPRIQKALDGSRLVRPRVEVRQLAEMEAR